VSSPRPHTAARARSGRRRSQDKDGVDLIVTDHGVQPRGLIPDSLSALVSAARRVGADTDAATATR